MFPGRHLFAFPSSEVGLFQGHLFAFPSSEVGLPHVFSKQLSDLRAIAVTDGHQQKIIPRPVLGWPHDLNPSS
jgi:hypothetical protein